MTKTENGFFACAICNLTYAERKTAAACKAWCTKHPGTCNPNIAEKAIRK